MKMNLLAFGIAAEICGGRTVEIEIPEGSRLSEVREMLSVKYPALKSLLAFSIVVNRSYRQDDPVIQSSDELAIIPPVSGG